MLLPDELRQIVRPQPMGINDVVRGQARGYSGLNPIRRMMVPFRSQSVRSTEVKPLLEIALLDSRSDLCLR